MNKMVELVYPLYFRGRRFRVVNPRYTEERAIDDIYENLVKERAEELIFGREQAIRHRKAWKLKVPFIDLQFSLEQIIPRGEK